MGFTICVEMKMNFLKRVKSTMFPLRMNCFIASLIGLFVCCVVFLKGSVFPLSSVAVTTGPPPPGPLLLHRADRKASQLISRPVYMSLTTISSRIHELVPTLTSLLHGNLLPDKIYIFISKEPYLLDQGISIEEIKSKAPELVALLREFPLVSIAFTANEGPHRKLLPLLAKHWNEDCVIITVDDHEIYGKSMLSSLVHGFVATNGTAVVGLRARRIAFCDSSSGSAHPPSWSTMPYSNSAGRGLWPEAHPSLFEMLLLPTGMGGVLYRPQFFHPVVFDDELRKATQTTDDLAFRLAAMAMGIPVYAICNEDTNPNCKNSPPPQSQLASKSRSTASSGSWKPDDALLKRIASLGSWEPVLHEVWASNSTTTAAISRLQLRLRRSRRLFSSREDEPAKKVSLATVFNNLHAGNTHNWHNGIKYLHEHKVFNYSLLLETTVEKERSYCMIAQYGAVHSLMPYKLQMLLQNVYDSSCGIYDCAYS